VEAMHFCVANMLSSDLHMTRLQKIDDSKIRMKAQKQT